MALDLGGVPRRAGRPADGQLMRAAGLALLVWSCLALSVTAIGPAAGATDPTDLEGPSPLTTLSSALSPEELAELTQKIRGTYAGDVHYSIRPVANERHNLELARSGVYHVEKGRGYMLPGPYGFCRSNDLCYLPDAPASRCYSQFYPELALGPTPYPVPTGTTDAGPTMPNDDLLPFWAEGRAFPRQFDPATETTDLRPAGDTTDATAAMEPSSQFHYPRCSSSMADFNSYNMTYQARLYLMDLDHRGYDRLVGPQWGTERAICEALFSDLCYIVMWVQNIRAGFTCNNANALYKRRTVKPPCRNFCHRVINSSATCHGFRRAVLRPGETTTLYCSMLPPVNCYNAAVSRRIPTGRSAFQMALVALLAVAALQLLL
ncbi:hypothetical protein H696_04635 [Fonticula alba]|uniref:FZ domain-containing protein n=1 Tax=Fonticula alba TaxID=691883 RepID=A0A058Z5J8_FONAL|nr:hypothetical protein H696_04635 [Fonticula alba]KCV69218.1 hypothetical protein H696_04635 [Fonticula alba]|eukprot:XP_009496789.1 hypothetical protein H696_04635 [Fonticula alba]